MATAFVTALLTARTAAGMDDEMFAAVLPDERLHNDDIPSDGEIIARFVDSARRFVEVVDDPMQREVAALLSAYDEDRDQTLSVEERVFLWALSDFLVWILDAASGESTEGKHLTFSENQLY